MPQFNILFKQIMKVWKIFMANAIYFLDGVYSTYVHIFNINQSLNIQPEQFYAYNCISDPTGENKELKS